MGFYKFMAAALTGCLLALPLSWATAKPKEPTKQEEKLVCSTKEIVTETLNNNKFFPLLNMVNGEKITETIWISGGSIMITAISPDEKNVCILATMTGVVYNSDTVEGLYKVFEAQLNKEKGI